MVTRGEYTLQSPKTTPLSQDVVKCLLYTVPMNINGDLPFLINTLDTFVRGINMLIASGGGYSVKTAKHGCRGSSAFMSWS